MKQIISAGILAILGVGGFALAQDPGNRGPSGNCCDWTVNNSCVTGSWNCVPFLNGWWKLVEQNDFPVCETRDGQPVGSSCTSHLDVCARFEIYDNPNCTGEPTGTATARKGHCDAGSDQCL
ncbi:MAG: hypothetical protein HRU76_12670 [Phycisphaeraceae bacterium]|nr:hypothetical protein [Phycisphaerales bacterium]QOJ18389.1 MAG: hypothetical protein HRU76_12670 [Phycisphaeraceae bacterium]